MPECPTEAQSEASRLNGALSTGPKDTSQTRLNATKHGFTAALKPPQEPNEAAVFHELFDDLCAQREPQNRGEILLLEEIASLEVRCASIQETSQDAPLVADVELMQPTMLLVRYQTDCLRNLGRMWDRFEALQGRRRAQEARALELRQREEEKQRKAEEDKLREGVEERYWQKCLAKVDPALRPDLEYLMDHCDEDLEEAAWFLADAERRREAERLLGPAAVTLVWEAAERALVVSHLHSAVGSYLDSLEGVLGRSWNDEDRAKAWRTALEERAEAGEFGEVSQALEGALEELRATAEVGSGSFRETVQQLRSGAPAEAAEGFGAGMEAMPGLEFTA